MHIRYEGCRYLYELSTNITRSFYNAMCTCGAFWQTMSNVEDICIVPFPFRYLNLKFNNILYRDMPLHHIRCSFLSSFFYEQMFAFSEYNSENLYAKRKERRFVISVLCILYNCWMYTLKILIRVKTVLNVVSDENCILW